MKLLSVGNDAKTVKGQKKGVLTGILYMAPHTLAGGRTLCPHSTAGCREVCLYSAGRGAFTNVQNARLEKARAFLTHKDSFVESLKQDIQRLVKMAAKKGMIPAVRLNGTTDILWEHFGVIECFPDVQFYDYTKWPVGTRRRLPKNYHLTYSYSEIKEARPRALDWLGEGRNVAVVFQGGLPPTFLGHPVINGDESDLRFIDPPACIVGLKAKGKAIKAAAGSGCFIQKGI
jgi:hypothetical protein